MKRDQGEGIPKLCLTKIVAVNRGRGKSLRSKE